MANDCSKICQSPWTTQCQLTQLTAQEYFPAKFLTRHTKSLHLRHETQVPIFYQNRHQIFQI